MCAQMEQLNCTVNSVVFNNESNGYSVLSVHAKGYSGPVTVVGNIASPYVGSTLLITGKWKVHSKWGRQFAIESWEEKLPATVYGLERYLGSGLIHGVGPVTAKRIVSKFGMKAISVIEKNPRRLTEVNGVGKKRAAEIRKSWDSQKEIKNIMLFLQECGVSTGLAVRIFQEYGQESIEAVKKNPYMLADEMFGVGFKTADSIAMRMGFERDGHFRCRAGLRYILGEHRRDGHCYMPRCELIKSTAGILEIEDTRPGETLDYMLEKAELCNEGPDKIYLRPLFFSEKGVCRRLRVLKDEKSNLSDDEIASCLERAGKEAGVPYDAIQTNAIRKALESKVMVLTGGPGTGKTTTTKGIISAFDAMDAEVLLAAPTGRAAKRLSETTGMPAQTIHRLLGINFKGECKMNAACPLQGDVLIVDELSMMDVVLMYNLLKAVPDTMTVILVGDADQLPSVGAGNVLRDIIESGVVPVVNLTHIYRQEQASRIVINAHRINQGKFPDLRRKDSDFFFIEEEDPAKIPGVIRDLCAERLPEHYGVDAINDIQVLSPMYRGETGATNLNMMLQDALNPQALHLMHGCAQYRLGDKVMQIRNNYDKDVFNGDIGRVAAVDTEARQLIIDYDGNRVPYDAASLDEVVLAYAISIHKSQGSEYPIVVLPFTMQHYIMLQRNLLYTAITRARHVCVLVGAKKAIGYAVQNNVVVKRHTYLKERLRGEV